MVTLPATPKLLIVAHPSETADRIPVAFRGQANVEMLQLQPLDALSQFDVSTHGRLSNSLAKAEADRSGIRRFVHSWLATHFTPDIVLFVFEQQLCRKNEPGQTPLRHFAAATALIETFVPVLTKGKNTRVVVAVGLEASDFFGQDSVRVGYRALESYLNALNAQYSADGPHFSFIEYLNPARLFDQEWPDGRISGFLRSLHPYTPATAAAELSQLALSQRAHHRPLRTSALFWLGKWYRFTGRDEVLLPSAKALAGHGSAA